MTLQSCVPYRCILGFAGPTRTWGASHETVETPAGRKCRPAIVRDRPLSPLGFVGLRLRFWNDQTSVKAAVLYSTSSQELDSVLFP
jgi:hypothetical protein